jgi:hypothetical protein
LPKEKTLEGSSPHVPKGKEIYELLKLLNQFLKKNLNFLKNGLSPNKQKELFTSDEEHQGEMKQKYTS